MPKDERYLKKIGKLLKMYGVEDEEQIQNFLNDIQDAKYDDEEHDENSSTETSQEETTTEEVANDSEETGSEEETTEGEETSSLDYQAKYEELKKSFDGLVARLSTLEDIVSKLGVEEKDETVGASPRADAVDESYDSTFDEINRKRVGY